MPTVKTRFAPSPTGFLHVGGARTALFNWLFARHAGGQFVLRVEDTDAARNSQEATAAILDGLRWLNIDWDGEPLFQSERTPIYEKHLAKLDAAGLIYDDEGATRFRVPDRQITFEDKICGAQSINLAETGSRAWDAEKKVEITANPDLVIRRPDGTFLFHFVNVVDDLEMGITHVLRGEDHLSNTPKHVALFDALGAQAPVFAHIPLILNEDGSKMSKRDAGAGLEWYQQNGYLPAAVANYISLLGWSPKDDRELLSIADITALFDFDHLNRSNAKFDLAKCTWLNGQYITALAPDAFLRAARPFAGAAPDAAIALTQPRVQKLSEIPAWLAPILDAQHPLDPKAAAKIAAKPESADHLNALCTAFAELNPWTADTIKATVASTAKSLDVKMGALMFPLRVTATGTAQGADLMPALEIIGRDDTITRIRERLASLFNSHD